MSLKSRLITGFIIGFLQREAEWEEVVTNTAVALVATKVAGTMAATNGAMTAAGVTMVAMATIAGMRAQEDGVAKAAKVVKVAGTLATPWAMAVAMAVVIGAVAAAKEATVTTVDPQAWEVAMVTTADPQPWEEVMANPMVAAP